MKKERIGLIIGCLLILFAILYSAFFFVQQSTDEQIAKTLVEQFKENINNENWTITEGDGNDRTISDEESTTNDESSASTVADQNTIGIMEIPSKNITFPVASSSAYDVAQTESLLKTHAVLYSDFGKIGMMGQNAIFSAHSSINNVGCGHCYFNHIEDMVVGDTFAYTDSSGVVYTYEVFNVSAYNDPNETWFYEAPTDESESWATLITCTYGDGNWRSIVCGKLIGLYPLNTQ